MPVLSRAALRVIKNMQRYRHQKMFVCNAHYGRNVIVADGPAVSRAVDRLNNATLRELLQHKLVTVSTNTDDMGNYMGQQYGDSRRGELIALTDSGKAI